MDQASGGVTTSVPSDPTQNTYWERRRHLLYYQVVRTLGRGLATDAGSILDVGSKACPYLEWFPEIPVRTSVDLIHPYEAEGIRSVTGDFLLWEPDQMYDLVLCLQVLEHVADATAFARKLLAVGRVVIISVPFRWPETASRHHIHDPVTLDKVTAWFGRQPNFASVAREIEDGRERLVCVFEPDDRRWSSLVQRRGGRGFRPAPGTDPLLDRPLTIRQSARQLTAALRRGVPIIARRAVRRVKAALHR